MFRKVTSFSPYQYLQHVRLKHGEIMLKSSGAPVSDIAYHSGFSSLGYFATAFKQKYKLSPGEYRKIKNTKFTS